MAAGFRRRRDAPVADAALLRRVRHGDSGAFDLLVERYIRAVYRVASSEVGTAAEAANVCEEAFLAMLERLEDCPDPARFPAWLLDITRGLARRAPRAPASVVDPPTDGGLTTNQGAVLRGL